MNSITVTVSPLITMFVHTSDGFGGPIVFSKANLADLTTHVLNELMPKFGHRKIRALSDREYVYPNAGIVVSKVHRISREPSGFAAAFGSEVKKLVDDLAAAEPFEGIFVLEARYSDEPSFAPTENMFSDYLYIYARLIKKSA